MLSKIVNTLIIAVIASTATFASTQAGPLSAPTAAEKAWMERASGPADGN